MRRQSLTRHSSTRGAAFVEGIIIIATLSLLLISMMFFRNVYLEKIRVARLARASLLAYSMGGCKPGQDPADWVQVDLAANTSKSAPPPVNSPGNVKPQPVNNSKRGSAFLEEMKGTGSGGNPLNPIGELGLSVKVAMTTRSNNFAPRRGYHTTETSVSYVTCGEEIPDESNGKYSTIMPTIAKHFNFKQKSQDPD